MISPELAPVFEAVLRALDRVEYTFDEHLRSHLPPVQRLVEHIESYRGKMLRPQLVCLCGIAASPDVPRTLRDLSPAALDALVRPSHVTVGAVCEMIHMATLVHDDVLDDADTRRKGATVNRLRGNETAVILGDYLFSSAYHLCSTLDSQTAALLIGACGMTLCTGELLQLHHRENFSLDQPTYFEIVRRKTGSLIAVACKLGAMQAQPVGRLSEPAVSASSPNAQPHCRFGEPAHQLAHQAAHLTLPDRFESFGLKLGVAFQIQDDLLDLTGNQDIVGKPLHRDIELGKLTLPVIHHLQTADPKQRGRTLMLLDDSAAADPSAPAELLAALERTGSIQHAADAARTLVAEAKRDLAPLHDSPAKDLLMVLADQVVGRSA